MAYLTDITAERLREVLSYDPETGEFRWRERPVENFRNGAHTAAHTCARCNTRWAGKNAGAFNTDGYRRITIDGCLYHAHRLAWVMMTGNWPPAQIDHRDLDKANNRFDNLRLATNSQNGHNCGAYSNNTSGVKGVSWRKQRGKWGAEITHNGKRFFLGYFDTRAEAAAAYAKAAVDLHGDFARVA